MSGLVMEVRTTGRALQRLEGEIVRELHAEDLECLQEERGVKPKPLSKIRQSHHRIARMIAEGRGTGEVANLLGYSQSHISSLRSDPAFAELVTFYEHHLGELADDEYVRTQRKLALVRDDYIEHVHDKLVEGPEKVTLDQALEVVKVFSDRTGHGPASKNTNLNVNVGIAERLASGRLRVARARPGEEGDSPIPSSPTLKVIEHE